MITTPSDMARNIRAKKRKLTNQLDLVPTRHGSDTHHHLSNNSQEINGGHEHGHTSAAEGFTGDPTSLVQDQTHSPVSKKARSTPASSSSVHHQETHSQDHHQTTNLQETNPSFQDGQDTSSSTAPQTRRTDAPRPAGGGFTSSSLNLFRGPSRTQIMRHIASLNHMWRRTPPPTTGPMDDYADCRTPPEDVDIVQEFDHEVSVAVTRIGGSLLGLNAHPDQLMESPGVRKLVARNLAWFHGSSDFFKLCGLLLAKKINRVIENQLPTTASLSLPLPAYPSPQAETQQEDNTQMINTENLGPLSSATSPSVLLLGPVVQRPQG